MGPQRLKPLCRPWIRQTPGLPSGEAATALGELLEPRACRWGPQQEASSPDSSPPRPLAPPHWKHCETIPKGSGLLPSPAAGPQLTPPGLSSHWHGSPTPVPAKGWRWPAWVPGPQPCGLQPTLEHRGLGKASHPQPWCPHSSVSPPPSSSSSCPHSCPSHSCALQITSPQPLHLSPHPSTHYCSSGFPLPHRPPGSTLFPSPLLSSVPISRPFSHLGLSILLICASVFSFSVPLPPLFLFPRHLFPAPPSLFLPCCALVELWSSLLSHLAESWSPPPPPVLLQGGGHRQGPGPW